MFTFASVFIFKKNMNKFLVSCTTALTILVSACQKEYVIDDNLKSQNKITSQCQFT